MVELVLFGLFAVLLLASVPVAFALGLAALGALVVGRGIDALNILPSVMYASLSSETLLAIPFFILAGAIMEAAGISKRLVDLANACLGHLKHGLVLVVIIAAFFFSAISGSGPATVAAIGSILIPALVRNGYEKRHAAALLASSGSMGIVIPPSVTFIVFAVVAGEYARVSIARLFVAGVVPGILMAIAFLIACFFIPRRLAAVEETATLTPVQVLAGAGVSMGGGSSATALREKDASAGNTGLVGIARAPGTLGAVTGAVMRPRTQRAPWNEIGRAFVAAAPGLLVPVIILGGIYGGIFTPTEAAVVAAFYAFFAGLLFSKEFTLRSVPNLLVTAAAQSAVIMLIVGCASVFAYVITAEQIARRMADAILGITENTFVILLLVTLLLLVVGAFIDAISAFYLFIPILVPVLLAVGVDPTQIGVLMTVNLAIGLFTPPVGVNLFIAAGIGKVSLAEITRGIVPFLIAGLVVLFLVTYIPAVSTWLPNLLGV
ncbi:C4-dicarboxylate ABC transporter permease [Cryobacterium sp. MLB-32]|uniref:TRAP transporter large permease n=1 Tax=Cryobacterium sp. MLB-32 TaxID=1529318 RepID=UPI0004E6E107|nr:TRAP transporter large permease [Cryobacterium sp. MLB-32]KFF59794.1 C4-dicarboxylate ABC transporter permease [Cryobacterium sp. MLB-32]